MEGWDPSAPHKDYSIDRDSRENQKQRRPSRGRGTRACATGLAGGFTWSDDCERAGIVPIGVA